MSLVGSIIRDNPLKSMVKNALDKPNLIFAVILVLSSSIFSLLISLVYSLPIDFVSAGYMFARAVIVWLVTVALMYGLLYIAKGKEVKDKFTGLLTAFSFVYGIRLILVVAFFILLLVLAPGLFGEFSNIAAQNLTDSELLAALQSIDIQAPAFVFLGLAGFLVFTFLMVLVALYFIYQAIARASESGILLNIGLFIIQLILFFAVYLLVP